MQVLHRRLRSIAVAQLAIRRELRNRQARPERVLDCNVCTDSWKGTQLGSDVADARDQQGMHPARLAAFDGLPLPCLLALEDFDETEHLSTGSAGTNGPAELDVGAETVVRPLAK